MFHVGHVAVVGARARGRAADEGGQQGGGLQLGLMAGLAFLGRPAEIEGKRAVALALRVTDGAVFLGPIPLGKVEPLY